MRTTLVASGLALSWLAVSATSRADDLQCHSTTLNAVATSDAPRMSVIQCDRASNPIPALRWTAMSAAAAAFTGGIAFEIMAANDRAALNAYAAERDPVSGLSLVRYADVRSLDQQRVRDEALGAGFLIAGGLLTAASFALWFAPSHGSAGRAAASLRERVAFGVGPSSAVMTLRF